MRLWRARSDPAQARGLPLDDAVLQARRLSARRDALSGGNGLHHRRRAGQALEFREYRPFVPGDDIRQVDWRVSARTGGPGDRVVRLFDAEEHISLAIVADADPRMALPRTAPKSQVARWLVQSLTRIAAHSGDRVVLPGAAETRRGLSGQGAIAAADGAWQETAPGLATALDTASQKVPAILAIVSDFYDSPDRRMLEALVRVQRRGGIVLAVELDTWPAERAALAAGPALIGADAELRRVEAGEEDLRAAERRIAATIDAWRRDGDHGGLIWTRWSWPAHPGDMGAWFAGQFLSDRQLGRVLAEI